MTQLLSLQEILGEPLWRIEIMDNRAMLDGEDRYEALVNRAF